MEGPGLQDPHPGGRRGASRAGEHLRVSSLPAPSLDPLHADGWARRGRRSLSGGRLLEETPAGPESGRKLFGGGEPGGQGSQSVV